MKIGDKIVFRPPRPPLEMGTVDELFDDGTMRVYADDTRRMYIIPPANVFTTVSYKNIDD